MVFLSDAYAVITFSLFLLSAVVFVYVSHSRGDIRIWPKNVQRDTITHRSPNRTLEKCQKSTNNRPEEGGRPFERRVGKIFQDLGYAVELTPITGDMGADLILTKDRKRIAVQVKFRTTGTIGQGPVREVHTCLKHYNADIGWVVTNSDFTSHGRQLAKENNVRLINGDELSRLEEAATRGMQRQSQPARDHHNRKGKTRSKRYFSRHQEYHKRN